MRPTDAIGLVSVIPHAWQDRHAELLPVALGQRRGTADPPHGMERRLDVSRPFSSGSTPIQIVGTPAATVTRSFTMRSAIAGAERSGPGITSVAPRRDRGVGETPRVGVEHRHDRAGSRRTRARRASRPSVAPIVCRNVERCE